MDNGQQASNGEQQEFEAAMRDAPDNLRVEQGDEVSGIVVSVGESHVFVDIGAKAEAAIPIEELIEDGELKVAVGHAIDGFVVSTEPELLLSRTLSRKSVDTTAVQEAQRMGLPVRGQVKGVNKGGLEVDLGGVRAFCPLSQIDIQRCEEPEQHLEQSYDFKVMEVKEGGRNVVVSRRALLDERRQEEAEAVREKIEVGAVLTGMVASLQSYGAFVDIGGGIQGMVHISEISRSRIDHPEEVLTQGQQVQVKVLKVEQDPKRSDRQRIGLSMKALLGNPWEEAGKILREGESVQGTVVRLQPFGAFVELLPGVDGLIHISEMADRRIGHPNEVVTIGQAVEVTVLSLDFDAKRVSLSLKGKGGADSYGAGSDEALEVGATFTCEVDRIKPFGLLVRYRGPGRGRGLIPVEETGLDRNANLRRAFSEGSEVKAQVIAIDEEGKVKFSIRACGDTDERASYQEYMGGSRPQRSRERQDRGGASQPSKGGFGTFGDLFSKVLDKD